MSKKKKIIIISAVVVAAILCIVFIVFSFIGKKAIESQASEATLSTEVQDATQSDVIVADRSMMDETIYEGKWFTVCDLFEMYLPDDWVDDTLTDEQEAAKIGCSIHDPDKQCYMQVRFYSSEDLGGGDTSDLDAIVSTLKEAGYTDAGKWLLNGIYCVVYTDYESDTFNVWIPGSDGELVTIIFTNQSNTDYQDIIGNLFLSISLVDDDTTADDSSK